MLASGADGTLTVSGPCRPGRPTPRLVPDAPLPAGVYSPDGTILAAPGNDDTVTLPRRMISTP